MEQLRGFLGLNGYYRKFVKDYASISAPLTNLLHKDKFEWSDSATVAFNEIKQAMISTPILRLPDFAKSFTIETDASDINIGAVLLQDDLPLAYHSRKLGPNYKVLTLILRNCMPWWKLYKNGVSIY